MAVVLMGRDRVEESFVPAACQIVALRRGCLCSRFPVYEGRVKIIACILYFLSCFLGDGVQSGQGQDYLPVARIFLHVNALSL